MDQGLIARVGTTWTQSKDQWVWHQGQWVKLLQPPAVPPMAGSAWCYGANNGGGGTGVSFEFMAFLPNRGRRYRTYGQYRAWGWEEVPWSNQFEGEMKSITNQIYLGTTPPHNTPTYSYDVYSFARDPLISAMVVPQIERRTAPGSKEQRGKADPYP